MTTNPSHGLKHACIVATTWRAADNKFPKKEDWQLTDKHVASLQTEINNLCAIPGNLPPGAGP